jgi:hypothetical protein
VREPEVDVVAGESVDRVGGVPGRDGVGERAGPGEAMRDVSIVRAYVPLSPPALRRELRVARCGCFRDRDTGAVRARIASIAFASRASI